MAENYKADLTGVFGYPVAENPTGVMQEAAFAALGLNWRYLTIEVKPEGLADAFQGMRAMGFAGINLTIPHKVAVLSLLDEVAPDAALIGAVNTVRRDGDRLIGENTDGKGFLRGVREDGGIDPAGKRVIIFGAGGAARAIATELALAGAAHITIVNRSEARGVELVSDLKARTTANVAFAHWNAPYRVDDTWDIVVNSTSIGLFPEIDAIPDVNLDNAANHALVCDVIPNPPDTPFIRAAEARGLQTINGLSMLVYQGAIGFKMWTGHDAPEDVMKDALRRAFGL